MKSFRRQKRLVHPAGFTLLELLIVLAIIVAIAAMVAPNLMSSQRDALISTTRATIKNIEDAAKRRAIKNNGEYSTDSDAIKQLAEPWEDALQQQQPPELEEYPLDAWNNEFQYSFDPNSELKPKIWSFGPDGQDGGGSKDSDDVSNVRRDVD